METPKITNINKKELEDIARKNIPLYLEAWKNEENYFNRNGKDNVEMLEKWAYTGIMYELLEKEFGYKVNIDQI